MYSTSTAQTVLCRETDERSQVHNVTTNPLQDVVSSHNVTHAYNSVRYPPQRRSSNWRFQFQNDLTFTSVHHRIKLMLRIPLCLLAEPGTNVGER
jgi:hypothetical protein